KRERERERERERKRERERCSMIGVAAIANAIDSRCGRRRGKCHSDQILHLSLWATYNSGVLVRFPPVSHCSQFLWILVAKSDRIGSRAVSRSRLGGHQTSNAVVPGVHIDRTVSNNLA